MHWFPAPNEDSTYLRCLKLKISKMWLPLQYIAVSAHKSSDAIVLVLLNDVHREANEWRKKEKYGRKSRRMERDILKDKETTGCKNRAVRKRFNGGDKAE